MSLNPWSLAALGMEVLAALLIGWDLWQTRSDVNRYGKRDRSEIAPGLPMDHVLRNPWDPHGADPQDLAGKLALRDDRMDQIDHRIDNEIQALRDYIVYWVPTLVAREAEGRRAEDDAVGQVIGDITLGGMKVRAISLLLIFLSLVFTTIGQLTTVAK